mmetsp:Transcript_1818/g.5290  ORF Transcript_1818/g.5290 Transcript_1818/m.5290 type:complete len:226 (+) Transcript_1818:1366-2043(+)
MTFKMRARLGASGRSTSRRRGRRRTTASSRSPGRLVAASTSTRSLLLVRSPSQLLMNSFLIFRMASCSLLLSRRDSIESTSSMKMTAGARRCARLKRAFTYFSPSPNHLEASADMLMLRKLAPDSAATALASIVLPVPGGPNRRTPLVGLVRAPRLKSSGRCSGSITTSRRDALTASRAPMSSKVVPTSSGGMTSSSSFFSKSLSSFRSFHLLLPAASPSAWMAA